MKKGTRKQSSSCCIVCQMGWAVGRGSREGQWGGAVGRGSGRGAVGRGSGEGQWGGAVGRGSGGGAVVEGQWQRGSGEGQ